MWKTELDTAAQLAREAGEILLQIYATDFEVRFKGVADPVTEADRKANEHLVRELQARFPDDAIVAEETVGNLGSTRARRCWYVDPLDGTKEFIAKNGEFSVMLGLSVEGQALLGVVYQPVLDKLYLGIVGEGAECIEGGRRRALRVSAISDPSELGLVVSRSHRPKDTDMLCERLGIQKETSSGSVGLKVGLIAEQKADLYVHISDRSCVWDSCGPEAILRAAGGRFTTLSGKPFVYRIGETKNSEGILACNANAYEPVLKVVANLARETGFLTAS